MLDAQIGTTSTNILLNWLMGAAEAGNGPCAALRRMIFTLCAMSGGMMQWGVAYELAGNQEQQAHTLEYLEWREKQVR